MNARAVRDEGEALRHRTLVLGYSLTEQQEMWAKANLVRYRLDLYRIGPLRMAAPISQFVPLLFEEQPQLRELYDRRAWRMARRAHQLIQTHALHSAGAVAAEQARLNARYILNLVYEMGLTTQYLDRKLAKGCFNRVLVLGGVPKLIRDAVIAIATAHDVEVVSLEADNVIEAPNPFRLTSIVVKMVQMWWFSWRRAMRPCLKLEGCVAFEIGSVQSWRTVAAIVKGLQDTGTTTALLGLPRRALLQAGYRNVGRTNLGRQDNEADESRQWHELANHDVFALETLIGRDGVSNVSVVNLLTFADWSGWLRMWWLGITLWRVTQSRQGRSSTIRLGDDGSVHLTKTGVEYVERSLLLEFMLGLICSRAAERFAERLRPTTYAVCLPVSLCGRLAAAFKRKDVKTVFMQDGLIGPVSHLESFACDYDSAVVWGKGFEDRLRRLGWHGVKTAPLGVARQAWRATARGKREGVGGTIKVVFASQFVSDGDDDYRRALMWVIETLPVGAKVRIRPHPRENVVLLRRWLETSGNSTRADVWESSLDETFEWADVMVSAYSTVLVEAVIYGVVAVAVNASGRWDPGWLAPILADGSVASRDQLQIVLHSMCYNQIRSRLWHQQLENIRRYVNIRPQQTVVQDCVSFLNTH